MERKTKSRLLIGGLIVFSALIAVYTYWVFLKSDDPAQDWQAFLLNVSTELIGALIVFFFFNLFFFLDDWDLSERVTKLLQKLERERPSADNFFQKPPDIESLIYAADSIDLCGVSLTSTINRQVSRIRDSLLEGKAVRLLIIDPRSYAIEMANARSETQDIEYYKKRLDASLSDIVYLQEKWEEFNQNGNPGTFQVRLIPYAPSFGIQIFHQENKGKIIVEIYSHHGGYGNQPFFTLDEMNDTSWYSFFNKQFEEIWNKSSDWSPQLQLQEEPGGVTEISTAKAEDFLFENNPDLTPYFQDATDIRLFGIDLNGTIRNHLDSLSKSLAHEDSFIQLIITSEKYYTANQKDSLEALKWLAVNPKNKGKIEVREFQGNIHFAMVATDPLQPTGSMQVRMYTQFWKLYKQPRFELFKKRDPKWVEYFLTQYDLLWEKSIPIFSSAEQEETIEDDAAI